MDVKIKANYKAILLSPFPYKRAISGEGYYNVMSLSYCCIVNDRLFMWIPLGIPNSSIFSNDPIKTADVQARLLRELDRERMMRVGTQQRLQDVQVESDSCRARLHALQDEFRK
ncbi:nck-associated protein 5 [Plakobranchus ocellatus]|uniref:Nck-associated protein 5 n=1 Tax=Plakobranchus ocellatus TaxID=259542 RepID=A0AAV4A8F8_9GAST|nr:nck-associated protein 5 [Plakobranchus ocellatus]